MNLFLAECKYKINTNYFWMKEKKDLSLNIENTLTVCNEKKIIDKFSKTLIQFLEFLVRDERKSNEFFISTLHSTNRKKLWTNQIKSKFKLY